MSVSTVLFIVTVITAVVGVPYSFLQTGLPHMTGYMHSLIALFAFIAARRVFGAAEAKPGEPALRYFGYFIAFWGVCGLLMSLLSYFLFPYPVIAGVNLLVDVVFMVLAALFLLRAILVVKNPRLAAWVFWLLFGVAVLVVIPNIIYLPKPSIAPNGITLLGVHPLYGSIPLPILILLHLVGSVFFFVEGARSDSPFVRSRSLTLGTATLSMAAGLFAYTLSVVVPRNEYLLSLLFALLVTGGILLLMLGVLEKERPEEAPAAAPVGA